MKKILFLLLFPLICFAQSKPDPWHFYNDYTGSLPNPEVGNFLDTWFKEDTLVCTVLMVDDYPGDINEYTRQIGNIWGLYDYGRDAIVVTICPSRKMSSIQISRSLESVLSDGECGVIRKKGSPFFKNGDINGGVMAIVSELKNTIKSKAQENVTSVQVKEVDRSEPFDWFIFLGSIFGVSLLGFGIFKGVKHRQEKESREQAEREKIKAQEQARIQRNWEASPAGILAKHRELKAKEERERLAMEAKVKAEEERKAREIWLQTEEGILWLKKEKERIEKENREREEEKREQQAECLRLAAESASHSSNSSSSTTSQTNDNSSSTFDFGSSNGFGGGGSGGEW